MELIILGSGTCVPSLKRGSSGLVVKVDGKIILIDSGSGTLERLLKAGITYRDVDVICYTHVHPDHISDLVPFLFTCSYGALTRQKDLLIIGGEGFIKFFNQLTQVFEKWLNADNYKLDLKELVDETIRIGNLRVSTRQPAHCKESVSYRLESSEDQSIVLSGDTDYCESIISLGKNADILVLECSFPDEQKTDGHLSPSVAGKIAAKSKCKKLILTHFYPLCEKYDLIAECRKTYSGEVVLAEDLMKVQVNS
jgi:ribonuclease BN (tRNA processing enzyme)